MEFEDPWAWMQPYDVRRFGDAILDRKEQECWCRAVLLGGLPFMWRKAEVVRNLIYNRLELQAGDEVLIIGECIEPWQWSYTREIRDSTFDCAACLQGAQHTDDWREAGAELLRVMKSGRDLVLAEIAYSPETRMKIELDMHIEYVFDKLLSRVGWKLEEFPYYSLKDLQSAFAGLLRDVDTFVWKGLEVFWGRKP